MPFSGLPASAQACPALAMRAGSSSLLLICFTSSLIAISSRFRAHFALPLRHHTCLRCGGSRGNFEQSCGFVAELRIILRSGFALPVTSAGPGIGASLLTIRRLGFPAALEQGCPVEQRVRL